MTVPFAILSAFLLCLSAILGVALARSREALKGQASLGAQEREAHEREKAQIREAHAREVGQLREAHEREAASLREQARRDAEAAKQNLELTVKAQTAALDEQLAAIQKALAEASAKSVREGSDMLRKDNLEQVNEALRPFNVQLEALQKELKAVHEDAAAQKEWSERQFADMMNAAQGVKAEAGKLSTALHGGAKVQGNWGEMVLDSILSASGLRDGEDYVRQSGTLTDDGGIPDVVVNLPEGRKVVVDSKVVLTHWQDYLSAETDEQRAKCEKENVAALRKQVDGLSKRNYPGKMQGSLSHALLFVPVEASYALAMKSDPKLFMDAFRKRVVIVGPSTLVVTLEIIRQLWLQQRVEKQLGRIARTGEALYNKLVGFAQSMAGVENSLQKANDVFRKAKEQLFKGKGNAVSTTERLCEDLGLKPKKRLTDVMPDAEAVVIDAEATDAESAAVIAAAGRSPTGDGDGTGGERPVREGA